MSGTSPARFPYFLLTLLSAFLGAALMYGLIAGRVPGTLAVKAEPAASHGSVVDLQNAIVHAAEVIAPSVVNIDTVGEGQSGVPDLFGRGPARKGQGSGVIVSADGYILTNDHVVDGAAVINVTFNDKRQLKATLQGADKLSDIAIVKVDARDLPAATLGDSDRIPIGAFLIAVGSPLGYQHTVTLGVLSGRGREVPEPGKEFRDLLQTDAAINPGNSGGPLVDIEGHVIGINTAIIPQAQGIGFAIPINSARDTMKQLIATGKVVRPYIGVVMQPVTEEYGLRAGLNLSFGCQGGSCGTCMVKVQGEVYQWGRCIDEEEIEQGFALICSSYPRSDLIIDG